MDERLNQLAAAWRGQGRGVYEVPAGVGVEFDDGNDAWWVLPGEPSSSVDVSPDAGADAEVRRLMALFETVNARRRQVVHVLRHYIASQRYFLDRSRTGHWGVMTEWGMSSHVNVGAWLTKRAQDEADVAVLVRELLEHGIVRRPSPKRVARHLSAVGDPPDERPFPAETPTIKIPNTLMTALGWMGLCKALDREENFKSPQALAKAVEPKGKIGKALLRLARRLPNASASTEITTGAIDIDFSDGLGDFVVNPKSRELAALVRDLGPEDAGDRLADAYEMLDRDRSTFLGALYEVLAGRGYRLDRRQQDLHFGRRYRELFLDAGEPLSKAISAKGPAGAARQLLAGHGDLAVAAAGRIARGDVPPPAQIKLEEADLPPAPPESVSDLPPLEAIDVGRIDRTCRDVLDAYLADDQKALRAYFDPNTFDRGRDTWATPEPWLAPARRNLGGEWPRPNARLILIEQGDRSVEPEFVERLRQTEPHHEVWDAEVIGAWRYRHQHPDIARRWFAPERYQDLRYVELRTRLGDPPAVRDTVMRLLDAPEDEPYWEFVARLRPETARWFADEAALSRWHAAALRWARDTWQWSYGGDPSVLAAAASMGWADVGEVLESNPYLRSTLLGEPPPGEEPSVTAAGQLLLAWSRLRPSLWLARLIAAVFGRDPAAAAEKSARDVAGVVKSLAQRPEELQKTITIWKNNALRPLAVAWTRCRPFIPGSPRPA